MAQSSEKQNSIRKTKPPAEAGGAECYRKTAQACATHRGQEASPPARHDWQRINID